MRIDHFIIGMLVFLLVVSSSLMVYDELSETYGVTQESAALENLSTSMNTLLGTNQEIDGTLKGGEIDDSNTEQSLYAGGFKALLNLPKYTKVFGTILSQIRKELRIPPIFELAIIAILAVLITWTLIYFVFRFQNR